MRLSTHYINEKLLIAIENSGIEIPKITTDDIDLTEYIVDSIQFVSMVINIEEELGVVLPDEFLLIDNFRSIIGLVNQLKELVEAECSL